MIIDEYSRYPFVEKTSSTSAEATIPILNKVFAEQGIPTVCKTDNGPPFQSDAFRRFADHLGFHHRKITPLWPQANSEVERFMRTLNRAIKAACASCKNWKKELQSFLRNYRATPHSTTKRSPFEDLYQRPMKVRLPDIQQPQADDKELR